MRLQFPGTLFHNSIGRNWMPVWNTMTGCFRMHRDMNDNIVVACDDTACCAGGCNSEQEGMSQYSIDPRLVMSTSGWRRVWEDQRDVCRPESGEPSTSFMRQGENFRTFRSFMLHRPIEADHTAARRSELRLNGSLLDNWTNKLFMVQSFSL